MRKGSFSSVRVFYPRYSREEVLNRLAQTVPVLQEKLPLKQVMLFGSYASGRHTVASDIDVLIVYAGERREEAYALVKQTLSLFGVEPHVYSEGEAQRISDTLQKMTHDGVLLYP